MSAELHLDRLDVLGCGGCVDQHRPLRQQRRGPRERGGHHSLARGKAKRIDAERRALRFDPRRYLTLRGQGTASRNDGAQPAGRRQVVGRVVSRQPSPAAKVLRQAQRDARARGDQRQVGTRRPDTLQIVVRGGIDDGDLHPCALQPVEPRLDRVGSARHGFMAHQSHFALRLPLQHSHQIGIGHGRKRMMLHAALIEQHVARKEVALEHAALVFGKGGAGDGEARIQCAHQSVGHGSDVAAIGGIEGGAVLEIELAATGVAQPAQCPERCLDRLCRRSGARFQRHDDRVHPFGRRALRDAYHLHRAQAMLDQHPGEIGAAGEIVCDTTEHGSHSGAPR